MHRKDLSCLKEDIKEKSVSHLMGMNNCHLSHLVLQISWCDITHRQQFSPLKCCVVLRTWDIAVMKLAEGTGGGGEAKAFCGMRTIGK